MAVINPTQMNSTLAKFMDIGKPQNSKKVLKRDANGEENNRNHIMESFFVVSQGEDGLRADFRSVSGAKQPINLSQPIVRKPGEEREICVARFGRIYKRKVSSKIGYLARPCSAGYRYCRVCDATLPLSAFYTTVKRYICKRHHYLRSNKTHKVRLQKNAMEKKAYMVWLRLCKNRFAMGYDKVRFDCSDIRDIIEKSGIPQEVSPNVVPIDPRIPLRPRNVAVVSIEACRLAIKLYKFTCSRAMYIGFIQKSNLLPVNFDVARPDDPFHDPTYIRKFYDFADLLKEELSGPLQESEDLVILDEVKNKEDVPWINCVVHGENKGGFCRDAECWKLKSGVAADNKVQGSI
jgi:hypothetical protein